MRPALLVTALLLAATAAPALAACQPLCGNPIIGGPVRSGFGLAILVVSLAEDAVCVHPSPAAGCAHPVSGELAMLEDYLFSHRV